MKAGRHFPRLQRMTPRSRQDTHLGSRHTRRHTGRSAHTRVLVSPPPHAQPHCASACSQHTTRNAAGVAVLKSTRHIDTPVKPHKRTAINLAASTTQIRTDANVDATCHVPASTLPGQVKKSKPQLGRLWGGELQAPLRQSASRESTLSNCFRRFFRSTEPPRTHARTLTHLCSSQQATRCRISQPSVTDTPTRRQQLPSQ